MLICSLRRYIGLLRQEELVDDLRSHLDKITVHDFQLLHIEPYRKDGGVFVKFSYSPPAEGQCLQTDLREDAAKHGPLPNWIHIPKGDIWVVKGSPWMEDMSRFVTPNVKVTFDGPDVKEEALYELFRVSYLRFGCVVLIVAAFWEDKRNRCACASPRRNTPLIDGDVQTPSVGHHRQKRAAGFRIQFQHPFPHRLQCQHAATRSPHLAGESPQDCPANYHFPPRVPHIHSPSLVFGISLVLTSYKGIRSNPFPHG